MEFAALDPKQLPAGLAPEYRQDHTKPEGYYKAMRQ